MSENLIAEESLNDVAQYGSMLIERLRMIPGTIFPRKKKGLKYWFVYLFFGSNVPVRQ